MGQRGDAPLEAALLANLLEVLGDLEQLVQVELGVVRGALERGHQHLGGRLARAEGKRHRRRVDHVDAGLDGLQVGHGRQAADVVAVQLERQVDLLLEAP